MLSLPALPSELLITTWRPNNKKDAVKINTAALCMKTTLCAMCGMHVHTLNGMKREDIESICEAKYFELVNALKAKFRDAVVLQYVGHVDYKKIRQMQGSTIYRLSQNVRKICVNSYNVKWNSCLVNDQCPSGRGWDWVRMRVLVQLWREANKNLDPMPSNQGI